MTVPDAGGLFRLIYVSRNLLTGSSEEVDREILRVLETSRRNNLRDDVTGALLFNEDCFVQVLEGEGGAVNRVYERIQVDPRHRETVVLDYRAVEEREFGDWSMAYAGRTPRQDAGYAALTDEARASSSPAQVMALLRDVAARSATR